MLLTYKSSGAEANVWPAIFGFINPIIISIVSIRHRGHWEKPTTVDKLCLALSLTSLFLWILVHNQKEMAQYALYIAIGADIFAGIPTINLVWRKPDADRPFPWALFAVGYGLGAFAVPQHTFANYVLPIYMFLAGILIATPLLIHRIKKGTLKKEWI